MDIPDSQRPTVLGGDPILRIPKKDSSVEKIHTYGATVKGAHGKEYGWMCREFFDDLQKLGDIGENVVYPKEWEEFARGKSITSTKEATRSSIGKLPKAA